MAPSSFAVAKVRTKIELAKQIIEKVKIFCLPTPASHILLLPLCRLTGLSDSSAVGSVPRSGRGGREFESPLSDQLSLAMDRTDTPHWFAMRATYHREMKAYDELTEVGVKVFIPMRWTKKKVGLRMKRVEEPAIRSLLFVYCSQPFIQQFKLRRNYLQYICSFQKDGVREPIIVPDQQMEDFIRVSTQSEELTYIDPETENIAPGTRVRIISGPFEGMIGTFQRVNGHRNRQFLIQIEGVLAIAIQISPNQIEIIK